MNRMRRGLILAGSLLFAACGKPALMPRVGSGPLPTTELISRADAIFVGSITAFRFANRVHARVPLFPQLNDCLVPVRVTVSVENVLRGSASTGALTFYYFGTLCGTMGPVENPSTNPRSIFFLRQEHNQWRAIEDYWTNRVWVFSGRHPDSLIRGKTVEQAIPLILLTPGEGFSAEKFASPGLVMGHSDAIQLLGEVAARRLITPIMKHPDPYVRCEACITLESHDGLWDCAGPVLAPILDRLASGDSAWITPGILSDIQVIVNHADRRVQWRAKHLLPAIRIHRGPAGILPSPTSAGPR